MKGTGAVPVIRMPPRADVGATGSILPAERVRREPVAGGCPLRGGGISGSAPPRSAPPRSAPSVRAFVRPRALAHLLT
ncbi:hypothetical protein GCM10010332_21700 [Streptomyces albogriseolus]|nr:hypothetical protein GCM10010332_21700 [Streptomyces albogriseolus]